MPSRAPVVLSGTFTAAGSPSSGFQVVSGDDRPVNGVVAYLNVTAISGTTPSFTVTVYDSPDGSTWYPAGSFSAATATGKQRLTLSPVGQFVTAAVSAASGTTPSATLTVTIAGLI